MWLAGAEKDVVCAGVQASLCQFGEEEMGAICAWRYGVSWWNSRWRRVAACWLLGCSRRGVADVAWRLTTWCPRGREGHAVWWYASKAGRVPHCKAP
ncbi:hypothetical protein Y1Q_0005039 [Alligator mississippiensis]|uniref:Uncharacterized protein n=1 Tax=Alligator mississippiensis TaxID=8496 RepID=A0A151N016_ALLMI|nr:hypothetical protein Y1Q_0005039 [Alligator mississippiensis]